MSNSWSMEDIISGNANTKAEQKKQDVPKSTLQMLAASKPKVTPLTPVTVVTEVRGVTNDNHTPVREVTPLTPVTITDNIDHHPVAPVKNFQKVSNSIVKQAIPQGVFKSGKSKELYDVLYSLTRGAVNPSRTVRVSKPKLQKLAGIGAPQTLNQCLMHLQIVGLVKIINEATGGKHEGHEYEVLLYDEITPLTPLTPVTGLRNLPPLPSLQNDSSYSSLNVENKTTYEDTKTSLKTNTKDDDDTARIFETFLEMNKRFDSAVKKITGKGVSKNEVEKWSNLADLLILELEIAASRADEISSVPAFLTEVLRRQLFASRQQQKTSKKSTKTNKSYRVKIDTVGKTESNSYEIKPLDAKGREEALNQLQEFAGEDFLIDFKKWYTVEDWEWIMENMEASDKK